jgi:hypothetical protein
VAIVRGVYSITYLIILIVSTFYINLVKVQTV